MFVASNNSVSLIIISFKHGQLLHLSWNAVEKQMCDHHVQPSIQALFFAIITILIFAWVRSSQKDMTGSLEFVSG